MSLCCQWGGEYLTLSKAYRVAALQTWRHMHYYDEKYMCQGPYHKDWGVGTVSWHPSISGHQLRAGDKSTTHTSTQPYLTPWCTHMVGKITTHISG